MTSKVNSLKKFLGVWIMVRSMVQDSLMFHDVCSSTYLPTWHGKQGKKFKINEIPENLNSLGFDTLLRSSVVIVFNSR